MLRSNHLLNRFVYPFGHTAGAPDHSAETAESAHSSQFNTYLLPKNDAAATAWYSSQVS